MEGEWSCYVFPVAGKNHDDEKDAWRTEGCKQTADVARALFPAFEEIPYAR